MNIIGNILWIILGGGILLFAEYIIGGLVLCITIIGIPFGVQCFKLSFLALVPFGKEVVNTQSSTGCLTTIMNIIWILSGGIWVALTHLVFGLLCAITIIGLPFAKQHIKLAALALMPFGKEIKDCA
ncbi:MAG: YccF domain-containing protein [Ignavibacteriales bacterium]